MQYSVILPTLNENGHITSLISAIEKVFRLNKKVFEIIVIDAFGKLFAYEEQQDFVGEYTQLIYQYIQIKTQDSFISKIIVLQ